MLTPSQKLSLHKGVKLIFVEDGEVLSTKKGYVYTFSNWYDGDNDHFTNGYCLLFQTVELLEQGNFVHNFFIDYMEIFDPAIHKDFTMVTSEVLANDGKLFTALYGS